MLLLNGGSLQIRKNKLVFAEVLGLSLKQTLLSEHNKFDYLQMENKMRFHLVNATSLESTNWSCFW